MSEQQLINALAQVELEESFVDSVVDEEAKLNEVIREEVEAENHITEIEEIN